MPYIDPDRRIELDTVALNSLKLYTEGELNYCITKLLTRFLEANPPLNYTQINTVMGAIEAAKMEFYMRVARPYEDIKMALNGDVYDL